MKIFYTTVALATGLAAAGAQDSMTRIGGGRSRERVEKEKQEAFVRSWGVADTLRPWRIVNGTTNHVPASTNWFRVRGKVEQVGPAWVLVSGRAGNATGLLTNGLFFVRNLPYSPGVGDPITEGTIARNLGETTYQTASGQNLRAMVLDHGIVCEPQSPRSIARRK